MAEGVGRVIGSSSGVSSVGTGGAGGGLSGGGGVAGGGASSSADEYSCCICLDTARDAVVTFCGHLYCWPCLYRWLHSGHNVCPVCKAGVTRESVIPLYGRGGGGGGSGSGGGAGPSGRSDGR